MCSLADADLAEFLGALDGRRPLGEIISSRPGWVAEAGEIEKGLRPLVDSGVVRDADAPAREGPGIKSAPLMSRRNRPGDPSAPLRIENVAVNITKRCNLRCGFCYYLDSLSASSDGEVSASEVDSVLRGAKRLRSKEPTLVILGGEPLLREATLLDVAKLARRRGVRALVSTNGTLVTAGRTSS